MKTIFNYYLFIVFFVLASGDIIAQGVYAFKFGGKDYELVRMQLTWSAAAEYAVEKGGYLVHINSKEEQKAVYDAITKGAKISPSYVTVNDGGGIAYIWIGASDNGEEAKWLWDGDNDNIGDNFWNGQGAAGKGNGSVVSGSYVNWGGTTIGTYMEPDDYMNRQDAAAIALESWPKGSGMLGEPGEWNDINMSNSLYFIVEYDLKTESPKLNTPLNNSTGLDLKPQFIWSSVDADSYDLQLSKASDFSKDIVIDEKNLKDTFYVSDISLEFGNKYYWRVRAEKAGVLSSWTEIYNFSTKEEPLPDPPQLVSPENNDEGVDIKPVFIWNIAMADSYKLQVSTKNDFSTGIVIDKNGINDTLFISDIDLEDDAIFFWRAASVKNSKAGLWSEVWSFKTKLTPPKQPILSYPENNAVNIELKPVFKFETVEKADSYEFIISKSETLGNPIETKSFDADEGLDSVELTNELELNSRYYWSVSSKNAAGTSDVLTVYSFMTKSVETVDQTFSKQMNYNAYPNPATTCLTIEIPQGFDKNCEIFLISFDGKVVNKLMPDSFSDGKLTIKTGIHDIGAYFLKIISGKEVFLKKIVIAE